MRQRDAFELPGFIWYRDVLEPSGKPRADTVVASVAQMLTGCRTAPVWVCRRWRLVQRPIWERDPDGGKVWKGVAVMPVLFFIQHSGWAAGRRRTEKTRRRGQWNFLLWQATHLFYSNIHRIIQRTDHGSWNWWQKTGMKLDIIVTEKNLPLDLMCLKAWHCSNISHQTEGMGRFQVSNLGQATF